MSLDDTRTPEQPPTVPVTPRRRPRIALGTFWLLLSVLCFAAGFGGVGWGFLLGIVLLAYAVYLYRGGRYGFWFLPF